MEEPVYDASRPKPDITMAYSYELLNCPGMTIVGLKVDFPPNGSTPPHRHGVCTLSAYVFSGEVQNKVCDKPMEIIGAGGNWFEKVGCHHKISNNNSTTEPAVLFANLVLPTEVFEREGMAALIQIDPEYL